MLTNGTWNVTEQNVGLINIANIIGGNDYTDMLTDMVYNVDKNKQPDTNRVVLVDDVTMKGVKIFNNNNSSNNINYIGESNAEADNQAVSKDYIISTDNEQYIKLYDTRVIPNITTFLDITDIGTNLVNLSNINNIIQRSVQHKFYLLSSNIKFIFLHSMYYVNIGDSINPNNLLNNDWIKVNYLSRKYNVYKSVLSNITVYPQQLCIIDENDVNVPVYIKCNINIPITFNAILTKVKCKSIEQLRNNSKALSSAYDTLLITSTKYRKATFTGLPSDLQLDRVLLNVTYDTAKVASKYIFVGNSNGMVYGFSLFKIGDYYMYNNNIVTIEYSSNDINDSRTTMAKLFNEGFSLYFATDEVTRVDNFPLELINSVITNQEYVSLLSSPEIYIKDYIDNGASITVTSFYIRYVIPIQANLQRFLQSGDTKACCMVSFYFMYNNKVIVTPMCEIYIIRHLSIGIPRLEYPPFIQSNMQDTQGDAARFPIYYGYFNNTLIDFIILTTDYTQGILSTCIDPYTYIPTDAYYKISLSSTQNGKNSCSCDKGHKHYRAGYVIAAYANLAHTVTVDDNKSIILRPDASKMTYKAFTRQWVFFSTYSEDRGPWYSWGDKNSSWSVITSFINTGPYKFDKIDTIIGGVSVEPGAYYTAYSVLNTSPVYGAGNAQSSICSSVNGVNVCINIPSVPEGTPMGLIQTNYTDTKIRRTNFNESTDSDCRKYCTHSAVAVQNISGLYVTPLLCSVNAFLLKSNLFNRVYGRYAWLTAKILRDGKLSDPVRDRARLPEHQFAAIVCALKP